MVNKLILLFLVVNLYGKECYKAKKSEVCFKRFYDIKELKKPVKFTKYYQSQSGNVYSFNDKLKISLKYSGAILFILDNYDVTYFDQVNLKSHILKVKHKYELFEIISKLNELGSISKAIPMLNRIHKKGYVKPKSNVAKGRTTSKGGGTSGSSEESKKANMSAISGAFKK